MKIVFTHPHLYGQTGVIVHIMKDRGWYSIDMTTGGNVIIHQSNFEII